MIKKAVRSVRIIPPIATDDIMRWTEAGIICSVSSTKDSTNSGIPSTGTLPPVIERTIVLGFSFLLTYKDLFLVDSPKLRFRPFK